MSERSIESEAYLYQQRVLAQPRTKVQQMLLERHFRRHPNDMPKAKQSDESKLEMVKWDV